MKSIAAPYLLGLLTVFAVVCWRQRRRIGLAAFAHVAGTARCAVALKRPFPLVATYPLGRVLLTSERLVVVLAGFPMQFLRDDPAVKIADDMTLRRIPGINITAGRVVLTVRSRNRATLQQLFDRYQWSATSTISHPTSMNSLSRAARDPRARFVAIAAVLLVGFGLFQHFWTPSTAAVQSVDPQHFSFGTVTFGSVDLSGGHHGDRPALVLSAACWNYVQWAEDRVSSPDLEILNDAGLLRSAELLAGTYVSVPVAFEAENVLAHRASYRQVDDTSIVEQLRDDGASPAELADAERYLRARREPPSEDAADRYIVLRTELTAKTVITVRLEVPQPIELIKRPGSTIGDFSVRLPDGDTLGINESACWR
jgi:hypothetical protein